MSHNQHQPPPVLQLAAALSSTKHIQRLNTNDMVNINGFDFYEEPGICGTCPFLITGNTNVPGISCHSDRGLCIQWNEAHHTWANIPRRCKKIFKSAFALFNDSGETLTITMKE